jgi:adenylyl cyclase-associated protein
VSRLTPHREWRRARRRRRRRGSACLKGLHHCVSFASHPSTLLSRVCSFSTCRDDGHLEWCKLFKELLNGLFAYVKSHFKTGLTWNGRGKPLSEMSGAGAGGGGGGGAAASAAVPGKKPAAAPAASGAGGGGDGAAKKAAAARGGLFAQLKGIDQSSGKTAGLKHVTKGMKSKGGKGVAGKKKIAKKFAAKKVVKKAKPPSRVELVGKRWFVEHFDGGEPVTVDVAIKTQEVYVFDCDNATIIV